MPMPTDFLQQLRATFMVEAQEHLQTLSQGFLELEKQTDAAALQAILQRVFRAAHSLKGAARAVELNELEGLCQSLEDVFAGWRQRPAQPPPEAMDILHRCVDGMGLLLDAMARGAAPGAGVPSSAVKALRKALRPFAEPAPAPAPAALPARAAPAPSTVQAAPAWAAAASTASAAAAAMLAPAPPPSVAAEAPAVETERAGGAPSGAGTADTVRIALPKLAAQLLGAEELLSAKLTAGQRVAEVRMVAEWVADWRKAWAGLEGDVRRLRQPADGGDSVQGAHDLQRLLDFHDWSGDVVRAMEGRVADMARAVRHDRDMVAKLVDDLLDSTKQLLLLPFGSITATFQKLVRDLCRSQGKQAELVITGEQVEVDKLILEEIKDPLIHMLRNAVDHAVELPSVRERAGKPPRARIELSLWMQEGNQVVLQLSDDGAGISPARVRDAAVRRGLLSAEEGARMDRDALVALVFRPELSTSVAVTQVSGRGLGLAIAQERARKLGGDVAVTSEEGQGTRFRITLPASRASFRGVLCDVAGQQFLMATTAVQRVLRVRRDAVRSVEGRESLVVDGRLVGVVRLADVLEMKVPELTVSGNDMLQLVLVGAAEQPMAFVVDAVLDEQEVLVKPLRWPLVRVRNVAAAAVLGSGRLVPILNVSDLLASVRRVVRRGSLANAQPAARAAAARSILLAEDSITSRMLLKSILMAAGYAVKTAVDGMEAYAMLRTESFDLLVSDVEMPRLNGFDLTARVRSDKKLRDLPVVLVTALASRADRERGVDVGANAYIVKGSFDQNNLIAAVRQLL
jgi:two-component system chemotaxis sensor kinase CheA